MYLCAKGIQVFMNNQSFNSQREDNEFFLLMLWHNRCFVQMCFLIGTVSQVSEVDHGLIIGWYMSVCLASFHGADNLSIE